MQAAQKRAEQAEQQAKLQAQQLQQAETQLEAAQAEAGRRVTMGDLYSLVSSLESAVGSGMDPPGLAVPASSAFPPTGSSFQISVPHTAELRLGTTSKQTNSMLGDLYSLVSSLELAVGTGMDNTRLGWAVSISVRCLSMLPAAALQQTRVLATFIAVACRRMDLHGLCMAHAGQLTESARLYSMTSQLTGWLPAGQDPSQLPGGFSLPALARHLVDAKMGQAEAERQLR